MSTQQLTREEIARVYAMYYGQEAMSIEDGTGKKCYHKVYYGNLIYSDQMQLLLTPLDRISDEDAIEYGVTHLGWGILMDTEDNKSFIIRQSKERITRCISGIDFTYKEHQ